MDVRGSIKELTEHLSMFITEERKNQMIKVLGSRTQYLTVVLENIYQAQNASAVLRTCDCFGVQDVHIIENDNTYEVNPDVVRGANKWLNLKYYNKQENNTRSALRQLKEKGYKIVATTPHTNDINLEDYDPSDSKLALVFGTEGTGISDVVREEADAFLKIPMYGFSESFNISVSAAVSIHHLMHQIRESDINWKLDEEAFDRIYLNWLRGSIKKSDLIESQFYQKLNK